MDEQQLAQVPLEVKQEAMLEAIQKAFQDMPAVFLLGETSDDTDVVRVSTMANCGQMNTHLLTLSCAAASMPTREELEKMPPPAPEEVRLACMVLHRACYGQAKKAGWWTTVDGQRVQDNPYAFSNKLMLTVSELAEAMEGDRKNKPDDKLPHRPMREVELADALIRIFDMGGGFDLDLGGAVAEKLAFNAERADHKMENRQLEGGKAY